MASTYFRSLLLTSILSFLAPMTLVGSAIALSLLVSTIPGLDAFGEAGFQTIRTFLSTFGAGDIWEGVFVIGFTCASVGALLDTYSFYRLYSFRKL